MDWIRFFKWLFSKNRSKPTQIQIKIGGKNNVMVNPDDGGNYTQIQVGGKNNKQVIK